MGEGIQVTPTMFQYGATADFSICDSRRTKISDVKDFWKRIVGTEEVEKYFSGLTRKQTVAAKALLVNKLKADPQNQRRAGEVARPEYGLLACLFTRGRAPVSRVTIEIPMSYIIEAKEEVQKNNPAIATPEAKYEAPIVINKTVPSSHALNVLRSKNPRKVLTEKTAQQASLPLKEKVRICPDTPAAQTLHDRGLCKYREEVENTTTPPVPPKEKEGVCDGEVRDEVLEKCNDKCGSKIEGALDKCIARYKFGDPNAQPEQPKEKKGVCDGRVDDEVLTDCNDKCNNKIGAARSKCIADYL